MGIYHWPGNVVHDNPSAGHLREHIHARNSHRQFYSYKLKRLVRIYFSCFSWLLCFSTEFHRLLLLHIDTAVLLLDICQGNYCDIKYTHKIFYACGYEEISSNQHLVVILINFLQVKFYWFSHHRETKITVLSWHSSLLSW